MRKLLKWVLGVTGTIVAVVFLFAVFVVYGIPLLRDRTTQCPEMQTATVKYGILSYITKIAKMAFSTMISNWMRILDTILASAAGKSRFTLKAMANV